MCHILGPPCMLCGTNVNVGLRLQRVGSEAVDHALLFRRSDSSNGK